MEYLKAIDILKNLFEKPLLTAEEKEALLTAIGVLGWGSLAQSKTKALKAKRDKSNNTEWKHST
jgi:hypothetical protein